MWPVRNAEGQWEYKDLMGRTLDKDKFEQFKTTFYLLEGWDAGSGWPTRSLLESLDLAQVADTLQAAGRLGQERAS
jgi:aldehyde:ferredoxin oxidoreductase